MKTTINIFLFICIAVLSMSHTTHPVDNPEENFSSDTLHTIIVNFEYGEDFTSRVWPNIYAIWMEDTTSGFL